MLAHTSPSDLPPEQLLRWYLEAGVDEAIGELPIDRYAAAKAAPPRMASSLDPAPQPQARGPMPAPNAERSTSAQLAARCATLDELRAAMESYDGCALK